MSTTSRCPACGHSPTARSTSMVAFQSAISTAPWNGTCPTTKRRPSPGSSSTKRGRSPSPARPSPSMASVSGCCAATGTASRRCASPRWCASRCLSRRSEHLGGRFMTLQAGIRGLVIAAALAAAAAAHAHAHLDRASPGAGATLAVAPTEVTLHFTQQLEPKFSTIVVRDAAGKQVDKGDPHVSGEDLSVLKVSLQPLGSGSYKVEWRVISVDTHATKGEYSFRVGK